VSHTLGANFENLRLTGAAAANATGNALNNLIFGNGAANELSGGAGADRMDGGLGNDRYIIDNAADVAIESSASGGIDTVESSVSHTLGANVENIRLVGGAAANATGNALDNLIFGNGAANTLSGGAGADRMDGGAGNDRYIIDNAADVAIESSASGGFDTVESTVSHTLGANVENLRLAGAAASNGTGNGLANLVFGNAAANTLDAGAGNDSVYGAAGADILKGGTGLDRFYFDTALGASNVDKILDFSVADDSIVLENSVFTGLAAGALASGAFRSGSAAVDADDRIVYNGATGALLFDADGSGAGAAVQFATLQSGLTLLAASDFTVI
jgi:Ca2+-binding RTX toxin-like protein